MRTEALVHRHAHRDLVDETAMDAGDGDYAARAADIDHLTQNMRTIILQFTTCLARSNNVSG